MTSQETFIELLHRLKSYQDAMVLHALLDQGADEDELKISATQLAYGALGKQLSTKQVQRSLAKLCDMGLIRERVQPNYRTLIKADREAVMLLLATPVSRTAPGLKKGAFPFLTGLNTAQRDEAETQAEDTIKKARNSSSESGGHAGDGKPNAS